MKASLLRSDEFGAYYANYVKQATELELIEGLKSNLKTVLEFFESIDESRYEYSYAEGKWSIKEMIQHLIDTERVFAYRALRIARGDKINLPGFSQDDFVKNSNANTRSKIELLNDYKAVRMSTISLFESFDNDMLMTLGKASDSGISVRAIGFIIIGHEWHHCNIIKSRYL